MKIPSLRSFFQGEFKPVLKPALFIWAIFLAIWLFIRVTHLGFQHDAVGLSWGPPGTPVTFLQVILVSVSSFVAAFIWHWGRLRLSQNTAFLFSMRHAAIFIALWGLAVLLWSNEPMRPTHFSPPPMPPNQETYPHSDALLFDRTSYHLLYGTGFADRLARRPLYVGVLALFHGVVGGNYEKTMLLQILLLALIPGLVFLFTSKVSNPVAGLIAGGLIVLREKNSIALSGDIVTSHAKLMMSDMIATLGVALILYLAVRWLFKEKPRALEFAIVGACLGLTALIRAQVLILVVPLLLFVFLQQKQIGQTVRSAIFVLLGIILVMAPWVWRNWNLTGTFVLDDRGEERLLARNYSLSPTSMPAPLPGETDDEFSARLKADIVSFIVSHPREVTHFVANHFLRNLAASAVHVAPNYSADSPSEVVENLPFWADWSGDLTRNSRVALFVNLGLIALGIAVAVAKNRQLGLFPLVIFLTYSLGNALVRSSGWRFNQPADWIVIVYFSIAIAWLPSKIGEMFGTEAVSDRKSDAAGAVIPQVLNLAALFLIGASVPMAERLIPARDFNGLTIDARTALLQENVASGTELAAFLEQEDAVLLSGIGLYPRYVRPNSRFNPLEDSKDYRYLHLWLINEGNYQVVLPLQNVLEDIPHTATVSILGCREEGYISAVAVIVHEQSQHILWRTPEASLECPLMEPQ